MNALAVGSIVGIGTAAVLGGGVASVVRDGRPMEAAGVLGFSALGAASMAVGAMPLALGEAKIGAAMIGLGAGIAGSIGVFDAISATRH